MNNLYNLYKEAMDEINISDQCLRKVKGMSKNSKKVKKFRLKYAVVLATLVLSFFAFNIVSYAATGKDLTSHISNAIEKRADDKSNKVEEQTEYDGEVEVRKYKGDDGTEVEEKQYKDNLDKENMKIESDVKKDGDIEVEIRNK